MTQYNISIVTFLDILGFRKFVEKNESTPEKVKSILDKFYEVNLPVTEIPINLKRTFINFSDSFLRSTNLYGGTDNKIQQGTLYQEILSLAYIQGTLFLEEEEILIRGGITLGKIFAEEEKNIIFGPAFHRAYELESEIAFYPRIIIDQNLLDIFEKQAFLEDYDGNPEEEREKINELLIETGDGVWFINYLKVVYEGLDKPKLKRALLSNHQRLIQQGCRRHPNLNTTFVKYEWLARYHNKVFAQLNEKDSPIEEN